MKIVVLDFSCNELDTIEVEESFIDEFYEGEVEMFLSSWCGYDTSNCQWMAGVSKENRDMTLNDYGGDDLLELSDNDKKKYNIKKKEDEVQ